ncbi:MAG: M20/M25/M40 family metallo-hydrolase [Elusimicrobiaceae bacterium]|nr:M20/M25/M40 family metallo-hydrolase [Elusimicrobiaceae bacterium]
MKFLNLFFAFCFLTMPLLAEAPLEELREDAKQHLINLISFDTTQPSPKEIHAARYIYTTLNKNKIDWEIYRPQKNRANLAVRLKSSLPNKEKKPAVLLISHLDTAAIQGDWTVPPVKATIKDGKIYGRGSRDAKNYAAINLTLLNYFAKNKELLNRDLIFLFTADEESGSEMGLKYLIEKYPEIFNGVTFAINEGGGVISNQTQNLLFAEAASKMYLDILLTANASGGNSSQVQQDNAIYKLSQALGKLKEYELPYKLTPFTRKFFEDISAIQDQDAQTTINMLLNPPEEKYFKQAAAIISEDPFLQTQIQDNITPTILTSSEEANTVLSQASALLNCRLLPSTNPQEFFDKLTQLFDNDEDIILTIKEQPILPFPQPKYNFNDELYLALEKGAKKVYGQDTKILLGISPASSESEILRRQGILTYGIGPRFFMTQKEDKEEKIGGPHQTDEFIEENAFVEQLYLTLHILENLLGI